MPWQLDEEELSSPQTRMIEVFPTSILSENKSPDIPFRYSINPYNGCEHGCVYCYARNTHEYWGYSAGRDFEEKILYKANGHGMLSEIFRSGKWKPELIVLSGNTDCYQPAERKMQLTRRLLEVFLAHRHPVGIITKNALILRDLDILRELNNKRLLHVTLSITTLDEELRRTLEPRTSSVINRLKALEALSASGIRVHVNMAPIIPGLNSDEIFHLIEEVANRGAVSASYILARLNGPVAMIFEDWIRKTMPDRADKVLNLIRSTHDGALGEYRWKTRMKGEGEVAESIASMFRLAVRKFLPVTQQKDELDFSLFTDGKPQQLKMF